MPIDFFSTSERIAAPDQTIAVGGYGLTDLNNDDWNGHGARFQLYSQCYLWYMGMHHTQRREIGDLNITMNYVRTMSDYITNFCFGKPIQFRVAEEYGAILPRLLHDAWETDNDKQSVMWELGQSAGITGDAYAKVAFEEPWVDSIGVPHPGRIRVIPLSPLNCMPEYHPHDRERLIRFKMRYKFYGRALDGKRTAYTFVEILTPRTIEQYINDELVESYANPIGMVPVVHIPNVTVSGSPFGHSDIYDIISLNRELNEKATDISDIINYGAAPITIITGAKASNLERGAKKVWAIPNKDVTVQNLSSVGEIAGSMQYMEFIKRAMHEITGVPESALGQTQPISNTSGVALDIQFRPMINRLIMKKIQFVKGLKKINELIIRTAAVHTPEALAWTEGLSSPPQADQLSVLDPFDPGIYRTTIHWPDPLPVDQLIKLNEVQAKMAMGLESKSGALDALGEEFPNEKLAEIQEELMQDALDQGALDMIRAKIQTAIMAVTGMVPDGGGGYAAPAPSPPGTQTKSAGGPDVTSSGAASAGSGVLPGISPDGDVVNQLIQRAYGAQLAQARVPNTD